MSHNYQEPVAQLLTLGHPNLNEGERLNYLDLGFTAKHIPQLLQMAQDVDELLDPDKDVESAYAPVHAWYVLEQLQAHEAIDPLIALLDIEDETDWITEEVPKVLTSFGAAVLEPVTKCLSNNSRDWYYRTPFSTIVRDIGLKNPEYRDRCVQILTNQLKQYTDQEEELNGFLVSDLIDLRGVEAEQFMKKAFDAGMVDKSIMGGWDTVQDIIQDFKNRPADSTEEILDQYYAKQWTYHTLDGAPTKQYFLAMAPLPDDLDITIERTIFLRSLKRTLAYCPACRTQMRNITAPFVIAHADKDQGTDVYFDTAISSCGYFCPSCPAITVDLDQFWEDLEDEDFSHDEKHIIIGVVDAASIAEESAHLSVYDIDPPPIVPYTYEGMDGALKEKKRSYVRSKKKKKRR